MGIKLQTYQFLDNGAGLDLKSSPTKTDEDACTATLNMEYQVDGAFLTRNGSNIVNKVGAVPTPMADLIGRGLFDYKKSDGTEVKIVQNGGTIYQGFTPPVATVMGLNALAFPDMEFQVTLDNEYLFWGNGIDTNLKFDGTIWTNWSIADPANQTVADDGVGVLPAGEYSYYVQYVRRVSGVVVQRSDLNPIAQSVTVLINHKILITRGAIPDSQVTDWIIFRESPTSTGIFYQLIDGSGNPVYVAAATATYSDNIATDGTIEAEFDDQPAPKTDVFETYLGRMYVVPEDDRAVVKYSKVNLPWNIPEENILIFDGPVRGMWKAYGALMFGTDKSLWVLLGDADTNDPLQVSHRIGILNNRCAVGDGVIYILASNRKFYSISPTDFSQKEIRIDEPLSIVIEPLFASIGPSAFDLVSMEYYTSASEGKVLISCPIVQLTCNSLIIYNETQSFQKEKPCWHLWNNINASVVKAFTIDGATNPYSTDYAGYIWKLDDNTTNGDGAEENGTATSGTVNTLTDTTKTWTVNEFRGVKVRLLSGLGINQESTITSNTADTITFSPAMAIAPSTNQYTIGGYDAYHFSNWKSVTGSYDTFKQLWFFFSNLNASGDYNISLIIQYDFDTTESNQTVLNINLQSLNSLWGFFLWGEAPWGARSVFQDRIRVFGRFRAVRFGFLNREAGQPYQVNAFSLSVQDKGLFYGAGA